MAPLLHRAAITRNTFCGTWYVSHSRVYYDRQCHFFSVHVRNMGLKTGIGSCEADPPCCVYASGYVFSGDACVGTNTLTYLHNV